MIERILVPTKLLPVAADPATPPRRTSSFLDTRQLVPAELPVVPLDARSNIPTHVPLEVLGERTVVPRHQPITPLEVNTERPAYADLDSLDERVTVPVDARPATLTMAAPAELAAYSDVVEPDVFTTGEANLLIDVEDEKLPITSWIPPWAAPTGTAIVHLAIFLLLVFAPQIFPAHVPTHQEIAAAARSLGMVYIPPEPPGAQPAPPPGPRPSDRMRIDPRVLKKLLPEQIPAPPPAAMAPPQVQPQLPDAPRAQMQQQQQPVAPAPAPRGDPSTEQPRFEPVPKAQANPNSGLILPRMSAGRAIEDSARSAAGGSQAAPTITFGGRIGGGGLGGGGMGGQGGGGGTGEGALQMLTPTEGVDFSNYLARVLASIKRNWYAVIPESARLGERGRVVLQFRILRDGSVPQMDPRLMATSTKEHLDRAAMSSIRASNPFEPLPGQFSGPFIELRIIYLYNLPLDYAQ